MSRAQNEILLNLIYKNAKTSIRTIDSLLTRIENKDFRTDIYKQRTGYMNATLNAFEGLHNCGSLPHEDAPTQKRTLFSGVKLKISTNHSASFLSQLIWSSCKTCVDDINKGIRCNLGADQEYLEMARRLMRLNEKYMNDMNKYMTKRI